MKEASGELSMTAVAVVAIAAIGVVFSTLIWPAIKNNIRQQTYCSAAYNCSCAEKDCECKYRDEDNTEQDITCPASTLDKTKIE